MYIPKINLATDTEEVVNFMKRFSFATIITSLDNVPVATHLPFLVEVNEGQITLTSHFAKANDHWKSMDSATHLIIFSEPHAYISPRHYELEQNVPTWNYISVHAYGKGEILRQDFQTFQVLEKMIENYENDYMNQWKGLSESYKSNLLRGIVAFKINVTELQGKKKLSQNKTEKEKQSIIDGLSHSTDSNEKLIAEYMTNEKKKNDSHENTNGA